MVPRPLAALRVVALTALLPGLLQISCNKTKNKAGHLLNRIDHPVSSTTEKELLERTDTSVTNPSAYPLAIDPWHVGKYPAETSSGAGYFYDDVLEYRVWFFPADGGDDRYAAFAQYEHALEFSKATPHAEAPLVLVRQREWIDEPEPGHFVPQTSERITEWDVKWLAEDKRGPNSIAEFLKHPRPSRN
jgi:hypothetical protein